MLLYSLRLTNNLLGAVLPQEIVREMRFIRRSTGLLRMLGGSFLTESDAPFTISVRLTGSVGSCENACATNYILLSAVCDRRNSPLRTRSTTMASARAIIVSLLFHSASSAGSEVRIAFSREQKAK